MGINLKQWGIGFAWNFMPCGFYEYKWISIHLLCWSWSWNWTKYKCMVSRAAVRFQGQVYEGRNHALAIELCCACNENPKGMEQGFVLMDGTYVDRKTALAIAKQFKQIKKKHMPYDILLSEDLYDYSSVSH